MRSVGFARPLLVATCTQAMVVSPALGWAVWYCSEDCALRGRCNACAEANRAWWRLTELEDWRRLVSTILVAHHRFARSRHNRHRTDWILDSAHLWSHHRSVSIHLLHASPEGAVAEACGDRWSRFGVMRPADPKDRGARRAHTRCSIGLEFPNTA